MKTSALPLESVPPVADQSEEQLADHWVRHGWTNPVSVSQSSEKPAPLPTQRPDQFHACPPSLWRLPGLRRPLLWRPEHDAACRCGCSLCCWARSLDSCSLSTRPWRLMRSDSSSRAGSTIALANERHVVHPSLCPLYHTQPVPPFVDSADVDFYLRSLYIHTKTETHRFRIIFSAIMPSSRWTGLEEWIWF